MTTALVGRLRVVMGETWKRIRVIGYPSFHEGHTDERNLFEV
jgi:hypothetical protein